MNTPWMKTFAASVGVMLAGTAQAQEAAPPWTAVTRLLPEETFLWVATKDLDQGFREVSGRLERSGALPEGRGLDAALGRMLPGSHRDDAGGFLAALAVLGVRTDGPAAAGLLLMPDRNGRVRFDDDQFLVVLSVARQDALEALAQAEAGGDRPRRTQGEITVIGSAEDRFMAAFTREFVALGAGPAVALAVDCFLGDHKAVRAPPPGDGLFLAHFNPGRFAPIFRREVTEESQRRVKDGPAALSPAARQSLGLMEACEGLSFFADPAGDALALRGDLRLRQAEASAGLLGTKPGPLSLLAVLPQDAPLAAATSLTPELLPLWSGFLACFYDDDPQLIAALCHLAEAAAGRQSAFAFVPGTAAGEWPGFLAVAEGRDEGAARSAFEALTCLIVAETRAPFGTAAAEGAEIRTFTLRRGSTALVARSGTRLFFGTDLPSLQQSLARGGGAGSTPGPEVAAVAGAEPAGGALVFADVPRLLRSLADARRDSAVRSHQASCASGLQEAERLIALHREKLGAAPTDLPTMVAALQEAGVQNVHCRTNCVSDSRAPYAIGPGAAEASCPNHGTARSPKAYVAPGLDRADREAPPFLKVLGKIAVRLGAGADGFTLVGTAAPRPAPAPTP